MPGPKAVTLAEFLITALAVLIAVYLLIALFFPERFQ